MGTKFANLQIRQQDPKGLPELLPDCTIRQLSEGWTTVLHHDFHIGNIAVAAQKLSKKIKYPILSVGYYDDDVLVLGLFRDGKSISAHISDNSCGYEARLGNVKKFAEFLELEENDVSLLKAILGCQNLERKIYLLENLLGVCLWIKLDDLIDQQAEGFCRKRNISVIQEYLEEFRTANRLNNCTKVKLISEFEAMPDGSMYRLPDEEGNFSLKGPLYKLQPNGTLDLTFSRKDKRPPTDYLFTFSSGTSLFLEGRNIIAYDLSGNPVWDFSFYVLKAAPVMYNDFIYLHCDLSEEDNETSCFLKHNPLGEIVAKLLLPWGNCYWTTIHYNDYGAFFYSNRNYMDDSSTLYCLNENLEIISEFILDGVSFDSAFDDRTGLLYFSIFDRSINTFDTKKLKMLHSKKHLDYDEFICADRQGNLVISKGGYIEILNASLEIVSRHKLKGKIHSHFSNDRGHLCIVTWNGDKWDADQEKSLVRLHELQYKDVAKNLKH